MGASLLGSLSSVLGNVVLAQEDTILGIPTTLFFILGAVIVIGLGGLLFYLRSKQGDD
jgi:hypothetical protein